LCVQQGFWCVANLLVSVWRDAIKSWDITVWWIPSALAPVLSLEVCVEQPQINMRMIGKSPSNCWLLSWVEDVAVAEVWLVWIINIGCVREIPFS
jgi:hypothetical protein